MNFTALFCILFYQTLFSSITSVTVTCIYLYTIIRYIKNVVLFYNTTERKVNRYIWCKMSFVYLPHFFFCLFKWVSVVISILVRCYNALFVNRYFRIKALDFVRSNQSMLEFGHRRQQTSTIHSEGSISLPTQTKLNRKEI